MKIKTTLLFGFWSFFNFGFNQILNAQDPQFSQFYAAPLQLNPAMTGVFNGKFRAIANYKEQWNSILDTRPFRTIAASFDARNRIGKGDFVGYGISLLEDEAGQSNYQRLAGDLSLSYMKQLGSGRYRSFDQFLVAGAQVGVGQHSLDFQNLWFSSQFIIDEERLDRTLSSGEVVNDNSGVYLNINAGLLWYAVIDENKSLYFGGALHHINSPQVSFISDSSSTESLDTRWVAQFGGELPLNRELSILPAVVLMGQGPSFLSVFGANFRYTSHDWKEVAIRAGAWGHLSNDVQSSISLPAITITAILEMNRLNLGISYDINTDKVAAPTNGRGGIELSLIYVHPASRKERVHCPKL